MSSTGTCFDIGTTTSRALREFERTGNPFSGTPDANTAGNGSLMRLAPVPLFFANDPQEAIERSGESSRTTHGAQTAVDACRYFAGLIVGAVNGVNKETLLSPSYCPIPNYWNEHSLHPAIKAVADGSFKTKRPPQIRGTGYVVQSLEAALWAFHSTDSFRDGLLLAVNLGDDADTTGAIYGQLAGGRYGLGGIPENWRTRVCKEDLVLGLADQIYKAHESMLTSGT